MSETATLSIFEVRLPQNNEYTFESMSALLSNFTQVSNLSFFEKLIGKRKTIVSLEIVLKDGQIHFYIVALSDNSEFLRSQILAQYSTAVLKDTKDYLTELNPQLPISFTQLGLGRPSNYPTKTAKDFKDTDPLTSVLAPLSRSNNPQDFFLFQILLSGAPKNWQSGVVSTIQNGILVDKERNIRTAHPDKAIFEQKIQFPGLLTQINLFSNNPGLTASVSSSFGAYTNPRGNFIKSFSPGYFTKKKLQESISTREFNTKLKSQIFNTEELAAIWHFPNQNTKLPNIAWGKKLYSDPPENLPIADNLTPEEKNEITFFAKTEFRNKDSIFGIKEGEDRRRHTYIIGKSGTGKTTLISNMAIDDIRKGRGVAVIDPHGDLCNTILDYIPSNRINDCCYFNPADPEYAYPLNVLEAKNESQKELIASGVLSIFKKLYGNVSWG
ncbi:MAG: type IV secretion system DNA-binding domain-containing protein, partial [Candidatus Shapirobacteria bacterium]|nr:type IV secretion system DNA-binding domain-containing protein [Candidatus Shapirobacteria bacterium]